MQLSESVNELFTALSKFQGELDNAKKNKKGHGYNYADLANIINIAKPVLESNNLAVTQHFGNCNGQRTLITMLSHSSGQYMYSEFPMETAHLSGGSGKNPVQVLGSAITYQRRYAYAAIIGLAQEDNDAQGVVRNKPVSLPDNWKEQLNAIPNRGSLNELWKEWGSPTSIQDAFTEKASEFK